MTEVELATLAWWPGSAGAEGRLLVLAPNGSLPRLQLLPRTSPDAAARSLLPSVDRILDSDPADGRDVEPVTFVGDGGTVRLIYTAYAPPTATLIDEHATPTLDPQRQGWIDLSRLAEGPTAAAIAHVRNYWRQELEETSAVFDFLPQYFTTAQARSIYESVWGTPQDPGNFHRWLHRQNHGICTPSVDAEEVITKRDREAAPFLKQGSNDPIPGLGIALPAGLVGSSATALTTVAALLPGVALGAAVVGGRVAYQASKQRGPQPQWYTRTAAKRVNLGTLYGPRPAWLKPGEHRPPTCKTTT
ncbi:NrtR DNA-binding winged helix domain-containing protein [Luteipulveratus flavus]|uniref:NrtR DNA-binding winged helix domain-containing protein n=1 Tax=Luteipulveratus flavus TaxID=3031728 RepID=A0ABT6C218_9MICO|nr:hypothetical protein [Luteipulveratus sp. YIM 133296]MDF8262710.1 hypothetical protein [Luteipulveratus sp. YIM 133296]